MCLGSDDHVAQAVRVRRQRVVAQYGAMRPCGDVSLAALIRILGVVGPRLPRIKNPGAVVGKIAAGVASGGGVGDCDVWRNSLSAHFLLRAVVSAMSYGEESTHPQKRPNSVRRIRKLALPRLIPGIGVRVFRVCPHVICKCWRWEIRGGAHATNIPRSFLASLGFFLSVD